VSFGAIGLPNSVINLLFNSSRRASLASHPGLSTQKQASASPFSVSGNADGCRFADIRMAHQDGFDFRRANPFACHFDGVI